MAHTDNRERSPANATPIDALVVGLGRTGLSCVRHLRARGASVRVVDSRERPPEIDALRAEHPDVDVRCGEFRSEWFEGAIQIVASPGVSLEQPVLAAAMLRGVPVCGDIELFAREAAAPIIAITGSNGKSTVTSMLAAMCESADRRAAVGGNIGLPALSLLGNAPPALPDLPAPQDLYILELSSFQLETTFSLRPAVATVLNVAADHMDRYVDVNAYARAKQRIFKQAQTIVVNVDDARVRAMSPMEGRRVEFTLGVPGRGQFGQRVHAGRSWLAHADARLMPVDDLLVPGTHNLANALAALALGTAVDLPMEHMLQALRGFRGLPHRCELVGKASGVRWFNDSKGTNVGATVAAIEGLAGSAQVVLIAGGEGKGADFAPLAQTLRRGVRAVILFGRDAGRIESAIDAAGAGVAVRRVSALDDAVSQAAMMAKSGDCVLFSPACASFDMFDNYEARGDAYVATVRAQVGL